MKRIAARKGFTLIELIVVVLIIGILAAIAIIGFNSVTDKAHDAALDANAHQVASALAADAALEEMNVEAFLLDIADGEVDGEVGTAEDVQTWLDARFPGVDVEYSTGKVTITNGAGDTLDLDITGAVPQK